MKRRAFTLVELLTVVAVLGLLLTMLLPVPDSVTTAAGDAVPCTVIAPAVPAPLDP